MDTAFEVHMLNDDGKKKAAQLADMFNGLLESVRNIAGVSGANPTREIAIVRSKLEEACFYAKKAMANDPKNQAK